MNPINTDAEQKVIQDAIRKYNSYGEEWEKAYFDKFSGGFNVYHEKHNFAKKGGGGAAEKTVGEILAKYNGKQVEFLPEGEGKKPDVLFDNQTWDIKYIDNANEKTIRGYIEDIRKKEADCGIFYWENENKIEYLRNAIESEIGKLLKLGRINEMPDIYHIDKSGLLRTAWKK